MEASKIRGTQCPPKILGSPYKEPPQDPPSYGNSHIQLKLFEGLFNPPGLADPTQKPRVAAEYPHTPRSCDTVDLLRHMQKLPYGSKVLNFRVFIVSILGIVIMVWVNTSSLGAWTRWGLYSCTESLAYCPSVLGAGWCYHGSGVETNNT